MFQEVLSFILFRGRERERYKVLICCIARFLKKNNMHSAYPLDPDTYKNASDAIGKRFYFRNLHTLRNAIAYQNTFDASIVIDSVEITGVTSDSGFSTIYCSSTLWSSLVNLKTCYGDSIRVQTGKEEIASITKQGFQFETNEANTVCFYHDLFSDSFLPVAIGIEVLFGSLSLFLFANMLRQILKSKEKEYCVLSIVGVPRRQIIGNIVSYSATLLGLAFLLSWGGGSLFLYLLNLLFRSPQSFQLSFSLLSLNGWSLLIVFGLVLLDIGIIVLRGLKNHQRKESFCEVTYL